MQRVSRAYNTLCGNGEISGTLTMQAAGRCMSNRSAQIDHITGGCHQGLPVVTQMFDWRQG